MGLRSLIKKFLRKAEEITDREADRFDLVSDKLSVKGNVIADDAKDFAKRTYHNLKDVAQDIKEVSNDATKDIRSKVKEDFEDVKQIAEKRMHETRDLVKEKFDSSKETVNEIVEEVNDEINETESEK